MIYIGIDDTDNPDTRGTGFRARQLVDRLHENDMARAVGVTRHQLLVDDRIPYTSHNSSACLAVTCDCEVEELMDFCRGFLLEIAARGSDVGLCIANEGQAGSASAFGRLAQTTVVTRDDAMGIAGKHGIRLEGLTGDHQGVIGALSAVGLHAAGNDGRYIWLQGLRDHAHRLVTLEQLLDRTGTDRVALRDGTELLDPAAVVDLGPWPRTVRIEKQAVLLVEKTSDNKYKVLDKDSIKSVRP